MKKAWIYLTIFSVLLSSIVYAASIDVVEKVGSFACTVLYDENPVKEIDGVAVIPFGSEYKILLKNNNNRKAVAKITIDGAPISSFGDLVINANSEIILERFITKSLNKGERFKFVPLDHPDIDDPSREENGIIKVEFRLTKRNQEQFNDRLYIFPLLDHEDLYWNQDNWDSITLNSFASTDILVSNTLTSNTAEPGATIGGSVSEQKFHKVDIELDDTIYIVSIQLKGV